MGSFSGTCHLSGMRIEEYEPVTFVPVQYCSPKDTTTQCYSTIESAHISNFPLTGLYNGYGSINDWSHDWIADMIRIGINRNLLNSEVSGEHTRSFIGEAYALFQRENFPHEYGRLEFTSDRAIQENIKNRHNLHNIQKIESNRDLIDILSGNCLASISGGCVFRHGHLLIKNSFLNKLIANSYQDRLEEIKNNIHDHIFTARDGDVVSNGRLFHNSEISKDIFQSDVVGLFNDNHTFSYKQYELIRMAREHYFVKQYEDYERFIEKINNFIQVIAQQAIISIIYADLGKTFYPNAAPLKDHKPLYDYASLLKSELEALNQRNLDFFSIENGYDEEIQQRFQWRTHN